MSEAYEVTGKILLTAEDVAWALSLPPGGFGALNDVKAEVKAGRLAPPVQGERWLVDDLYDYADKIATDRNEATREKAFAANANSRHEAKQLTPEQWDAAKTAMLKETVAMLSPAEKEQLRGLLA